MDFHIYNEVSELKATLGEILTAIKSIDSKIIDLEIEIERVARHTECLQKQFNSIHEKDF